MADKRSRAQRNRRRRNRLRRTVVVGTAAAVVAAGAGTAWAMSGSDGTSYRLAEVTRADIAQTVDADSTLTSQDTATQSFAASGTVASVLVKIGETVTAGQVLATLDRSSLKADVTSAETTLANAKQTLADNEAGEASTSGGSAAGDSTSSGFTTDAARTGSNSAVLVADETTTSSAVPSAVAKAVAEVTAAQRAVVKAQSALDGYVADLTSACTTSSDTETTQQATADSDGSVSGVVTDAGVVTIAADSTTSDNPQTVASGGSWSFAGLTSGQTYRIVVVPVIDDSACASAISAVSTAEGAKSDATSSTLYGALSRLTDAIGDLETAAASAGASGSGSSSTGSGSTSSGGTTSGGTTSGGKSNGSSAGGSTSGPTTGSGSAASSGTGSSGSGSSTSGNSSSSGSSSTTVTITAAQIAADQKSIDAAKAALAVARDDRKLATLTTPISGTVATVSISAGSTVSASSSTDTIVITTDRALSVPVEISLADIDLIKIGEKASVTVDGRSEPLSAEVSMIGLANTSSSTGSSSTYEVTLVLDKRYAKLFDGMGASVAIDVGTARNAISVPVSAISTSGTTSTVIVYSGGKTTTTRVTLGVEGTSRVQVTDGLKAGDEVVLADLDAALPSSDSTTTGGSSLTSGGSGGFAGGGSGGPGGFSGGGSGGGPP